MNRGGIASLLQYSQKTGKPIRKYGYGGEVDGGANEYGGATGSASYNDSPSNSYADAMGPVASGGFDFGGWSGSNTPSPGYGADGSSIGLGETGGGGFGVGSNDGVGGQIGGSEPIGGGDWSGSYGGGGDPNPGMTSGELGIAAEGMTTVSDPMGGTVGGEWMGPGPTATTFGSNLDRALGPVGPASFGLNSLTGATQSPDALSMEAPPGGIMPTANPIGIPDLIDPNTFGYATPDYAKSQVNTQSISLSDRDIRDLAAINRAEAGIIAQNFEKQGYPPDVARQMAFAHVTDTVVNRSALTGMSIRDVIQAPSQFSPLNGGKSIGSLPASKDDIQATKDYLGTMATWGPQNPQATSFLNRSASEDLSWADQGTSLGKVGVPGTPTHEISTGVPGRYGGIVPDYNIELPNDVPRVDVAMNNATRGVTNYNSTASIPTPEARPMGLTTDTDRTYASRELGTDAVKTADAGSIPGLSSDALAYGSPLTGMPAAIADIAKETFTTADTVPYGEAPIGMPGPPSVQTVENTEQPPAPGPTQIAGLDPMAYSPFTTLDLGWTASPMSSGKAAALSTQTGYRPDWQNFSSPLDLALGIPAPGQMPAPTQVAANVPTPPSRPADLGQPPAPAPAPAAPTAPPAPAPAPTVAPTAPVVPASVAPAPPPAAPPEEEQKKGLIEKYGPTVGAAVVTTMLPFPVNAAVGLPSLFGGPNIVKDFITHIASGNATFKPENYNFDPTNVNSQTLPISSSSPSQTQTQQAPVQEQTPASSQAPSNDLLATLFDVDKFIGPHAYSNYTPRPA